MKFVMIRYRIFVVVVVVVSMVVVMMVLFDDIVVFIAAGCDNVCWDVPAAFALSDMNCFDAAVELLHTIGTAERIGTRKLWRDRVVVTITSVLLHY